MKKRAVLKLFTAVTIVVCLSLNPVFAAGGKKIEQIKYPELNKFELPEIYKSQTANGIKLRLIKNERLPLIDLYMLVKGGDVYDPPAKVGLASITARLLRIGGTKDIKPDRLDQLLDAKGISISISSGDDFFTVYLSCLRDNLPEAVAIFAKMLLQPAFDKEKLEEIKAQMNSAISRRNDEPNSINRREFNTLIYGKGSPFAAVLEYKHVDNISINDVAACYKRFFAPGNILAGIIGPVEIAEVKEIFAAHFGAWQNSARIPAYPTVKVQEKDFKVAFAEKSNLNQSYFSIGHLGVKEDVADFEEKAKIKMFNSIFSEGFSTRLMTRIRVKMGLTYGIGGGINTEYLYPGKTSFSTFTKSKSTIAAVNAIFDEINTIKKEKVSEKELQEARDYFLNSYVFEFGSPARILLNALEREFYGIAEDFQKNLLESIKKVTANDILETANKYLHPEKMIVFIVGKEEEIPGNLADLGKVKKVDISIPPPPMKEKIPAPTEETLKKGQLLISGLFSGKYSGYKTLKSLEITADTKMTISGRTFAVGVKSVTIFPDKYFNEMSIMGMKIQVIAAGDKGVMRQMGQERPLPRKDIEETRFGDLYHIFNSKGIYKFQYLKEAEIEGKKYDVIYLFDAKKNWVKLFINKETGLIEIEEKVSKLPGMSGIAREIKRDFKTIAGIPFAHKSETFVKDKKVGESVIKEIKVNPKIDETIFKLDKGEK